MALLFSPSPFTGFSPLDAVFDDLLSPSFGYPAYACARTACAAPAGMHRAAAAHVAAGMAARPYSLRVQRQPSFTPPREPEIHITRSSEGVLATSPLGRAFTRQDIR